MGRPVNNASQYCSRADGGQQDLAVARAHLGDALGGRQRARARRARAAAAATAGLAAAGLAAVGAYARDGEAFRSNGREKQLGSLGAEQAVRQPAGAQLAERHERHVARVIARLAPRARTVRRWVLALPANAARPPRRRHALAARGWRRLVDRPSARAARLEAGAPTAVGGGGAGLWRVVVALVLVRLAVRVRVR